MRMKYFRWLCYFFITLVMVCLLGCQRGDFKVSTVLEGQPSPHAGYNFGPGTWLEKGDPAVVTGAVIRIRGLDPNDLFIIGVGKL